MRYQLHFAEVFQSTLWLRPHKTWIRRVMLKPRVYLVNQEFRIKSVYFQNLCSFHHVILASKAVTFFWDTSHLVRGWLSVYLINKWKKWSIKIAHEYENYLLCPWNLYRVLRSATEIINSALSYPVLTTSTLNMEVRETAC